MADETSFDLTLERIALIRRMVVAWDATASGAPIIHPDAPYGSEDRDGDIGNVTGDDDGAAQEHRALGDGLAVFVQNAVLKPGRYQYHNTLAKLRSSAVSDVFLDEATGETPEHITFEVTDEHLRLVRRLNVGWHEAHDVPSVDARRPYGETDPVDPARHHEMQPALQIVLRYADLGPGPFRRAAGAPVWEPA